MGIAEKRLAMFDALLSGRGLQGLVDAAAEVLGNPIAVADMGLAMVAVSAELEDDPEWSSRAHDAETNDIRQASLAGDFRRVYTGDKTVVGEYPGAKNRYLAARIRRGRCGLGTCARARAQPCVHRRGREAAPRRLPYLRLRARGHV